MQKYDLRQIELFETELFYHLTLCKQIRLSLELFMSDTFLKDFAQSAGAVEYTDYFFAEG